MDKRDVRLLVSAIKAVETGAIRQEIEGQKYRIKVYVCGEAPKLWIRADLMPLRRGEESV